MILHRWDWNNPLSWNKIEEIDEATLTMLILAGEDPRLHNIATLCRCPKIGRRYCPECRGEGRWYHAR